MQNTLNPEFGSVNPVLYKENIALKEGPSC